MKQPYTDHKRKPLTHFVVWSNLFYLAPIAVLWPLQTLTEIVLALALVSLTLGSGAYHWQGFQDGFGHRWDETAMLMLLFVLALFVWFRVAWPGEVILCSAIVLLPVATAAVQWLSALWYVPLLAALSFVASLFAAGWMVMLPTLLFVVAAVVRGNDDNHWRHGLWHLGAALSVGVLIMVLP